MTSITPTTAPVALSELHKHFGSIRAVDGLDLVVERGEIYGLLGPNGAGKTTAIRCLLGYLNPTSGTASVLGGDARRADIRRRIGYLPGDLHLEPRSQVRALLAWFARLRGGVQEGRIEALLERFQLDGDRRFGELSKGNRQKVGVVQAFMHDPEVLILDEPTSGLDPLMQREVLRLVEESRDAGAAVLFSSHIIMEVEEIADRVGILRLGRKIVDDSVAGLQQITSRQSMRARFPAPVTEADFAGVPGLERVHIEGRAAELVVQGSVAGLAARLAELQVEHIATDPLVLDDLFYGVYDDKGSAA